MRIRTTLIVLACIVLVTSPAVADKPTSHIGAHPAWDTREGGETIETAIPVTLPFADTGATCDNIDDYDEACPYPGSTSPDVVYRFTVAADEAWDFDLYGSSYDTKVYLYDAVLNLVACNDDYYPDYTSKLELVYLEGGMTYYLVIDGYGGDCGAYQVSACPNPPCLPLTCPPDAAPEGEPPLANGYVDTYNGGCDTDPPVFQWISPESGTDQVTFCGTTGWFTTDGAEQRDSDWAEGPLFLPTSIDVMELQDCVIVSLLPYQMGMCSYEALDIDTTPGEIVTLRVRPTSPTRVPCAPPNEAYLLTIFGISGPVAVEPVTWGTMKQMYR
jgi:hypothetical protein